MSNTLYKKGSRYTWTNNTGNAVAVNGVVVLNSGSTGFIGIALTAIPNGSSGELVIGGSDERIQTLTKHSGEAFTDAQIIYWDATNLRLTGSSTGNTRAGRSYGTAATSATSANFIINQP